MRGTADYRSYVGRLRPANVTIAFALNFFDLWAHQWRRRNARGDVVIVRFCDDFVVGFEHRDDAVRFGPIFATGSRSSRWS